MRTRKGLVLMMALATLSLGRGVAGEQPTAEQKALNYFVGKWRVEMEIKGSPSMPASKGTGSEDCESFANLHVVCRAELSGPAGLYKSMRVISYVPALKQYGSYTIDSIGYAVLTTGQVQGGTWTFAAEVPGFKARTTLKASGDSYTTLSEYAGADGKWLTSASGKSTRAK